MLGYLRLLYHTLMPRLPWLCRLRGHAIVETGRRSQTGLLRQVRCTRCERLFCHYAKTGPLRRSMLPWSHEFETAMDPSYPAFRTYDLPRAEIARRR